MTYPENKDPKMPPALEAGVFTLAGASLGTLIGANLIAATINTPSNLSAYPALWLTAVFGGAIGLFTALKNKNKGG